MPKWLEWMMKMKLWLLWEVLLLQFFSEVLSLMTCPCPPTLLWGASSEEQVTFSSLPHLLLVYCELCGLHHVPPRYCLQQPGGRWFGVHSASATWGGRGQVVGDSRGCFKLSATWPQGHRQVSNILKCRMSIYYWNWLGWQTSCMKTFFIHHSFVCVYMSVCKWVSMCCVCVVLQFLPEWGVRSPAEHRGRGHYQTSGQPQHDWLWWSSAAQCVSVREAAALSPVHCGFLPPDCCQYPPLPDSAGIHLLCWHFHKGTWLATWLRMCILLVGLLFWL